MPAFDSSVELLTLKQAAKFSPYSADYFPPSQKGYGGSAEGLPKAENLLARKGKIKARKVGRDWLIMKSDLFGYLKKQQIASKERVVEITKYLNSLI